MSPLCTFCNESVNTERIVVEAGDRNVIHKKCYDNLVRAAAAVQQRPSEQKDREITQIQMNDAFDNRACSWVSGVAVVCFVAVVYLCLGATH